MRFKFLALAVLAVSVWTGSVVWGQGIPLPGDTLRVFNITAAAGDTGIRVEVGLRNSQPCGGFGIRFLFDTTVVTPRLSGGNLVVENTSRTDTLTFFLYGGSIPQSGVVTFSEATDGSRPCPTCPVRHIVVGSGPVVRIVFDVSPTASAGTYNFIIQDDTASPASFNRYTDTTGAQLFAPTIASGTLTITGAGGGPQNDPPVIASIPNQSVTEGESLTFNVTATDPEGDNITLQANSLPPNATFPTISGASPVTGTFIFVPNLSQGPANLTVTFRATDDSGEFTQRSVQIEVIDRPEDILVMDSSSGGIAGKAGVLVPIYLDNIQDVFGFQFDLAYNDSLITIDSFVPNTARMANFSIYTNVGDSLGFLTLVTFSLSGDSIPPGNGPVMYMAVTIESTATPARSALTLSNGRESISKNPNDPSLSLSTISGIFTVDPLGNINLDAELRVDVQDAVAMVNYLVGGGFFTPRQMDVADVNQDSSIDVGDLVGIINIILGRPIGSPIQYVSGLANVVLNQGDVQPGALEDIELEADFQIPVAGVQVFIDYDPKQIRFTELKKTFRSTQMSVKYWDNFMGRVRLIMFRESGQPITEGTGSILTLRAAVNSNLPAGEKLNLKISKLVLADTAAVVIPTGGGPIVPTNFNLQQNFPNPFNSQTTIRFEVPFDQGSGQVRTTLKVYNILGQKVRTLVDEPRFPGKYQVIWDGRDDFGNSAASGMYFYRLSVGNMTESKKMTLLK